jgi:ATP-dependent Lhr-like helicase
MSDILSAFHPLVTGWFKTRVGRPTDVQTRAWPRIMAGEHVLITAPTGSGKTLAAFFWAINQLVSGRLALGQTRVLYVSPLKALNNDIQRNLLQPLAEIKEIFIEQNLAFPDIRVLVRSGDTPASDRRQMLRRPPEILITTPESLNLLLSSRGGRSILTQLAFVILDEIHAVISNKRGTHLITAVDRLVRLSNEFQRIALSATLQPLETVAEFVGGYRLDLSGPEPRYLERPVTIIRSEGSKVYDLRIISPPEKTDTAQTDMLWQNLADKCLKIMADSRSTLIFVNSRRLCEKLAYFINLGREQPIAYSHHGSLSREIRQEVETRFKNNELKAIVATQTLELGIDIGHLDQVILIQSPFSVSSALQRIGRAGHQVGAVSHGTLLATHAGDLLEAAVLAAAIRNQDIEAVRPLACPLDVLSQVILSCVGVEQWDIDELYAHLQTSYPYRHLPRAAFELVLNMLAGRYSDSRIPELKPRIHLDRISNTVSGRKGALLALYLSGGTIPDRGYFNLRHTETNARIGELDEEFVWEAKIGQSMTFGTRNWKIQRITHNDIFVSPLAGQTIAAPFWKAEEQGRDFHLSERIGLFLEQADARLEDPAFPALLQQAYSLDPLAGRNLIAFLKRQKQATGCSLPHRRHLVVEYAKQGPGFAPGQQVIIHNFWGAKVNRPFALALNAAWEKRLGQSLELFATNECIVLLLLQEASAADLLALVSTVMLESLLRGQLEKTGLFGARFRECAGRALILTRPSLSQRMPLWLSRLRSQKLLEAAQHYPDFPILLETWRTCFQDEFDLENLTLLLDEIRSGSLRWSEVHTDTPSPLAQAVSWQIINKYMYRDDTPASGKPSALRQSLLHDLVFTPQLRPLVGAEIVRQFELKRQRLAPGYAPHDPADLLDWVKERLLIPLPEWEQLLQIIQTESGIPIPELLQPLQGKLVCFKPPQAAAPLISALEFKDRIRAAFYGPGTDFPIELLDPPGSVSPAASPPDLLSRESQDEALLNFLSQWLRSYGPATPDFISACLGISSDRLQTALEDLIEDNQMILGPLISENPEDQVCLSENYEILLRLSRAQARPVFEALAVEHLQLFLARLHGLTGSQKSTDRLSQTLEPLLFYPAKAALWETEILPARLADYDPAGLDRLTQAGELVWVGSPGQKITLALHSELSFLQELQGPAWSREAEKPDEQEDADIAEPESPAAAADELSDLFQDPAGRYDFSALLNKSNSRPPALVRRLWQAVWQGRITNDTFSTLRRGLETRFQMPEMTDPPPGPRAQRVAPASRRLGFRRFKNALPSGGNWYRLPLDSEPSWDLLETEERKKDCVRLLLDRYGILFRELLEKEWPGLGWSTLFRSLRLMEFSGEVLTGQFFQGIQGPQFIAPQAFQMLQQGLPADAIYWLNAADPVSLCGIALPDLKKYFPTRLSATHLVFHGSQLVLISKKQGKELFFHVPAEAPRIPEYLCVLRHLLTRAFQPLRQIRIETINAVPAAHSPYLNALQIAFDVNVEHKNVVIYKKI